MDTVPLVMMAATKIGERRARNCIKRCRNGAGMSKKARDGDYRQRTGYGSSPYYGVYGALKAAGFPEKQIYQVPTKSTTSRGHLTLPTQCWFNIRKLTLADRRYERQHRAGRRTRDGGQGFKAADIIGIGINGVDAGANCLRHRQPASTVPCCQARRTWL